MHFLMLDLTAHFCNQGISYATDVQSGNFTGFGTSYPAEQLPATGETVHVQGVPFLFPPKESGRPDNIELNEQVLQVPTGCYTRIHVLGASENGSYSCPVTLHGADTTRTVRLRLTDWVIHHPVYNDHMAFRCQGIHSQHSGGLVPMLTCYIWYQQVDIGEGGYAFHQMSLIDNPSMHIFAITLERERWCDDGAVGHDAVQRADGGR